MNAKSSARMPSRGSVASDARVQESKLEARTSARGCCCCGGGGGDFNSASLPMYSESSAAGGGQPAFSAVLAASGTKPLRRSWIQRSLMMAEVRP
ncbi:Os02g0724450 [Oryza sativa Japonica Group]|uniref:Os02g0724450 protein n=1 Tax=Oryza sativa subsp. japonica TaxID=39947 RepID=A0A0P0VP23_ORYSJ|nr:hypothetical protein EE612_013381 [Oryza sativa]BAS80680.1 Os02g0724450 [Oryza sativa Japonica Group]